MSKIKIEDGSGDRKYFTIIPNYILNHSSMWDREVFIQMKRVAGEGGSCWMSRSTLARQCGMSERRLDKSIKYLVEHGWIMKKGIKKVSTQGGMQDVNEYVIADLWKKNIDHYESAKGVALETIPIDQRGSTDEAKGIAPGADKEEPIKEDNTNTGNAIALHGSWNELIDAFKPVNPFYAEIYRNKSERKALLDIVDKITYQKTLGLIRNLDDVNSREFYPKSTKPTELKRNLSKLNAKFTEEKNKSSKKNTPVQFINFNKTT